MKRLVCWISAILSLTICASAKVEVTGDTITYTGEAIGQIYWWSRPYLFYDYNSNIGGTLQFSMFSHLSGLYYVGETTNVPTAPYSVGETLSPNSIVAVPQHSDKLFFSSDGRTQLAQLNQTYGRYSNATKVINSSSTAYLVHRDVYPNSVMSLNSLPIPYVAFTRDRSGYRVQETFSMYGPVTKSSSVAIPYNYSESVHEAEALNYACSKVWIPRPLAIGPTHSLIFKNCSFGLLPSKTVFESYISGTATVVSDTLRAKLLPRQILLAAGVDSEQASSTLSFVSGAEVIIDGGTYKGSPAKRRP